MGKLNVLDTVYSKENEKKFEEKKQRKHPEALLKLVEEETKPVTGIFRVFGADGNSLEGAWDKVTFRKFPEDLCPPFSQMMKDGETYTVPLYVARFLNGMDGAAKARNGKINSCSFAVHRWKTTQRGDPIKSAQSEIPGATPIDMSEPDRYKRTYGFETLLVSADFS